MNLNIKVGRIQRKMEIIREGAKDSVALLICSKLFLSEPITITYRYTKLTIFIFEISNRLIKNIVILVLI